METDDKRKEREEEAQNRIAQEEEKIFADEQSREAPSFWGSSGSWWIVGICAILIVFIIIWILCM